MLHRRFWYVSTPPVYAGRGALRGASQTVPLEFQRLAPAPPGRLPSLEKIKLESRRVAGEEPIVSGMAGRYATALFELALEASAVDGVKADLEKFDALVADNPDLARLVRSPVFSTEEQGRALAAVLNQAGIGGLAAKFLKIVTANRRLFAAREMIRGYNALVAKHKGEVTAQVIAAEKLNDARLAEIKQALKTVTGKDVLVDMRVDPSIIGGLIVKLGSRMVDSSLRTKLNSIKHAMKEVG